MTPLENYCAAWLALYGNPAPMDVVRTMPEIQLVQAGAMIWKQVEDRRAWDAAAPARQAAYEKVLAEAAEFRRQRGII